MNGSGPVSVLPTQPWCYWADREVEQVPGVTAGGSELVHGREKADKDHFQNPLSTYWDGQNVACSMQKKVKIGSMPKK